MTGPVTPAAIADCVRRSGSLQDGADLIQAYAEQVAEARVRAVLRDRHAIFHALIETPVRLAS